MTGKRARHLLIKKIRSKLKPVWRRCWWEWPLGHEWPGTIWTGTNPRQTSTCRNCGKPYTLDNFSEYDWLRLYEDAFPGDEDDPINDPQLALEPEITWWREY